MSIHYPDRRTTKSAESQFPAVQKHKPQFLFCGFRSIDSHDFSCNIINCNYFFTIFQKKLLSNFTAPPSKTIEPASVPDDDVFHRHVADGRVHGEISHPLFPPVAAYGN